MYKKKFIIAIMTVFAMMISAVSMTVVYASGEGDTTEHHFGTMWDANKTNENYHYLICQDPGCTETKEEAHRFHWEVPQFSYGDTEGYMYEICDVCGYQSGKQEVIPPLADLPTMTSDTTVWNGKSDITLSMDTKGFQFVEVGYSLYLENKDQVDGSLTIPAIDGDGKANCIITAKEIEDRLKEFGFEISQLENMNFYTKMSYNISDKPEITATHMVDRECNITVDLSQSELPEYSPTVSTPISLWTGEDDIVLNVQANGGNVKLAEFYVYSNNSSLGGINVTSDMQLDAEGNGKIVLNKDEIKAAKLIGTGNKDIDWTTINQIELVFMFNFNDDYQLKSVYIPVQIAEEESQETTLTDESGVQMALPENAPDNLELKVVMSDGTEEKEAVEKVVDIDNDKIKTFDLSLLLNNQPYDYDGQFKSTVTLPIPEGWNVKNLMLYYYNEETQEVTPVEFEVDRDNNKIVFETNHFSKYVLVQKESNNQNNTGIDSDKEHNGDPVSDKDKTNTTTTNNSKKTETPQTSDNTDINMYVVTLLISVLGFFVFTVKNRKKLN